MPAADRPHRLPRWPPRPDGGRPADRTCRLRRFAPVRLGHPALPERKGGRRRSPCRSASGQAPRRPRRRAEGRWHVPPGQARGRAVQGAPRAARGRACLQAANRAARTQAKTSTGQDGMSILRARDAPRGSRRHRTRTGRRRRGRRRSGLFRPERALSRTGWAIPGPDPQRWRGQGAGAHRRRSRQRTARRGLRPTTPPVHLRRDR